MNISQEALLKPPTTDFATIDGRFFNVGRVLLEQVREGLDTGPPDYFDDLGKAFTGPMVLPEAAQCVQSALESGSSLHIFGRQGLRPGLTVAASTMLKEQSTYTFVLKNGWAETVIAGDKVEAVRLWAPTEHDRYRERLRAQTPLEEAERVEAYRDALAHTVAKKNRAFAGVRLKDCPEIELNLSLEQLKVSLI